MCTFIAMPKYNNQKNKLHVHVETSDFCSFRLYYWQPCLGVCFHCLILSVAMHLNNISVKTYLNCSAHSFLLLTQKLRIDRLNDSALVRSYILHTLPQKMFGQLADFSTCPCPLVSGICGYFLNMIIFSY